MAKEKKKKGKRITAGGNIGRTPTQTIVLQPTRRGGLDVSAYMDSIRQAELIDWPRRAKLIDLYADVMLDGHLFSVLRKQKAAILSTPIQFQRDGNLDEAMQEHIDSPWFNRFIEDLINDEWEGVGGSLFQFFLDDKGWIDYNLIPRKHVDAINRTILCNQTDLTGESWDDFSDLLYVGNPRQIGHLAVAAFWVILKRNNVADWAELGEIFGRPIREGTYDAWDDKAREKLIDDIYNMGGAGVIVHPDGTKINLIQAGNISGGSDLYDRLHATCNNEISKIVNGNTLTTEAGDKGTQALGTVQQEGEVDIAFFIKRRILDILNYEVTDVFASMGIDTSGGKFAFVPPKKKDPEKQVTIVCRLKNEAGLPIDDDYLYEEFGIPKPDNYDEMKAAQQTAASATEEQAGSEDGESTDEDDPTKTGTEPKKNRKLTDRVRDFFGRAPESAGRIQTGSRYALYRCGRKATGGERLFVRQRRAGRRASEHLRAAVQPTHGDRRRALRGGQPNIRCGDRRRVLRKRSRRRLHGAVAHQQRRVRRVQDPPHGPRHGRTAHRRKRRGEILPAVPPRRRADSRSSCRGMA